MLPNAFLSIVDKSAKTGCLVVRSRREGDIQRVFPGVPVRKTPGNDYLFRADVDREKVAEALADCVRSINYSNHKGATANTELHDAYARVWRVMADLQPIAPYSTSARRVPSGRQKKLL